MAVIVAHAFERGAVQLGEQVRGCTPVGKGKTGARLTHLFEGPASRAPQSTSACMFRSTARSNRRCHSGLRSPLPSPCISDKSD
eukprot:363897-Chlamydomonas_euryale.AAC.15